MFSFYFYELVGQAGLTLALLIAGVLLVDHVQSALAAHDLAVGATFFDRCSYFHGF